MFVSLCPVSQTEEEGGQPGFCPDGTKKRQTRTRTRSEDNKDLWILAIGQPRNLNYSAVSALRESETRWKAASWFTIVKERRVSRDASFLFQSSVLLSDCFLFSFSFFPFFTPRPSRDLSIKWFSSQERDSYAMKHRSSDFNGRLSLVSPIDAQLPPLNSYFRSRRFHFPIWRVSRIDRQTRKHPEWNINIVLYILYAFIQHVPF